MNPAVVVVGYNRPKSLKRLLGFLSRAHFSTGAVPMVISLDYQDSLSHKEVVRIATEFEWPYGPKKVIQHPENLGLRAHVLNCGDLTETYGSVIVLEDDIIVSPYFYDFARQALQAYESEPRIAGISLYAFGWSQVADRTFTPAPDGNDVYFMQNPQSWGQAWSKRMWSEFREWYASHQDFEAATGIPDNVRTWSANSWLKYHLWYCVEQDKYFVYPFQSLSTNFTDLGQHVKLSNTTFQVPVLAGKKEVYALPAFNNSTCKYDVFLERQGLGAVLGIDENDLCTDLYGTKRNRENKRYWLTATKADFKIVTSFALELRPHELNVAFNVEGNDIFLYDTHIKVVNKKATPKFHDVKKTLFDIHDVPARKLLDVLVFRAVKKINRIKKG